MSIHDMQAATGIHRQQPAPTLVGRDTERGRLEQELRTARTGPSAVLVLRGGHGIGKTALLDCAAGSARGYRVVRARGVESEMQFPYAGLQLLCVPLLDHVEHLQPAHRQALETVLGTRAGPRPDPFLVGLATLNLLSRAAAALPLLCIIDDAQWMDRPSARVLAFVARRLDAQPILALLATRDTPRVADLDGLPELRLDGLSPAAARALLRRMVPGRMDQPVVERILTEARGHPLALLELAPATSPAALAGGFGVLSAGGQSGPVEDDDLERMSGLPEDSRQLLLTAAAEPVGDPALLWRAAAHLGIPPGAARLLESADLLRLGSRVLFRRPALRPLVYGVATNDERRTVHLALASATGATSDPARRAWHLAQASDGPDETLAGELEDLAPRALERGGPAAAAAFLDKATLLTLDPRTRVERALAAAAAEHEAGADDAAARLLHTAEMGPLDERAHGLLERLRAHIGFAAGPSDGAAELLLSAARRLGGHDAGLAREAHLEALAAAVTAGRLAFGGSATQVAKAADAELPALASPRVVDDLLDGLVVRYLQGSTAAAGALGRALSRFASVGSSDGAARWRWLVSLVSVELWNDEEWHTHTSRDVRLARETGNLAALLAALDNRAVAELHFGDSEAACRLVEDGADVSRATGTGGCGHGELLLAGWRGREAPARALFEMARRDAFDRSEGRILTTVGLATAVLLNGLGRHDEALAAAQDAAEPDDLALAGWTLPELVEAAVRAGEPGTAADALQRLSERTRLSGTDWALGIEAGSRALLGAGDVAEGLFREAIHRLGRTRIRTSLARTNLLYGEWLRREGRRLDARGPLRAARESFIGMGAVAFADRAQRELLATGEKVRSRSAGSSRELTPQEARVASLAREGLSNPAIGARMYVSPRTVEYHLHKVFSKLGITSRGELHIALPVGPAPTPRSPLADERARTRTSAHT